MRSEILGRPEKAATIGPLQCSTRLVRRRRGTLGSLRRRDRGQRAGRVAAHSLTLCLFWRRIETQCPILGKGAAEDGRLPSTPLPPSAWPGSIIIAKPAPILLTGGQRNVQATGQENPKLFPPDGLGIGAGGGIAPMGLAAALSYLSEGRRVPHGSVDLQ